MGVSLRTYIDWERAVAAPGYRNLDKVAAYYEVTPDFIEYGADFEQEVRETVRLAESNRRLEKRLERIEELLESLPDTELGNLIRELDAKVVQLIAESAAPPQLQPDKAQDRPAARRRRTR